MLYNDFKPVGHRFKDSWQKTQRTNLLKEVQSHKNGVFQSIIVSRGAGKNKFELGPRMRLIKLNVSTGEFSAERDE